MSDSNPTGKPSDLLFGDGDRPVVALQTGELPDPVATPIEQEVCHP